MIWPGKVWHAQFVFMNQVIRQNSQFSWFIEAGGVSLYPAHLWPIWAAESLKPDAFWIGDTVIFPAWSLVSKQWSPVLAQLEWLVYSLYRAAHLWPTWAGADWVSPPDTSYFSQLLLLMVGTGQMTIILEHGGLTDDDQPGWQEVWMTKSGLHSVAFIINYGSFLTYLDASFHDLN